MRNGKYTNAKPSGFVHSRDINEAIRYRATRVIDSWARKPGRKSHSLGIGVKFNIAGRYMQKSLAVCATLGFLWAALFRTGPGSSSSSFVTPSSAPHSAKPAKGIPRVGSRRGLDEPPKNETRSLFRAGPSKSGEPRRRRALVPWCLSKALLEFRREKKSRGIGARRSRGGSGGEVIRTRLSLGCSNFWSKLHP